MDRIGQTRLTMSKDATVNVYADIYMNSEEDIDDLYFIMFNILSDQLRLSLCLVSEFYDYLIKNHQYSVGQLDHMLKTDPEKYLALVQSQYSEMVNSSAVEKVKILLNSNRGTAYGRTQGQIKAKGDILIHLDDDAYLHPYVVEKTVEIFGSIFRKMD